MASRPYLAVYDYGTGGVWACIVADSPKAIASRYPELTVFVDPPPWWNALDEQGVTTHDLEMLHETWPAGLELMPQRMPRAR